MLFISVMISDVLIIEAQAVRGVRGSQLLSNVSRRSAVGHCFLGNVALLAKVT